MGVEVLQAPSGVAGLAIAKSTIPDLILCDIQMPHLDGHGVLAALRMDSTLADIPVIAVTALAMVGDRERLRAAGFNGYVSKPIEFDKLERELARVLPRRPL